MRILITGSAGFIGSHLAEKLVDAGHDVVGLDNLFTGSKANLRGFADSPRFEFVRHDVVEPFHIECDQVFHLACPASPVHYQRNPARTIETAVVGTRNALDCARACGAKILIASTSEVYGDPEVSPQREDYWGRVNPVGPRACYDEGKRCGESLAVAWANQWSVDVRIARIFNTYGPRMAVDDGRMLPNFINAAIRGKPLVVYGDGLQTRSLCYVYDTVDALVRLMGYHSPRFKGAPIVNVGSKEELSVLEIAEKVAAAFDPRPRIEHAAALEDDPRQRRPDTGRARMLLGWEAATPFEVGLATTVAWYMQCSGVPKLAAAS